MSLLVVGVGGGAGRRSLTERALAKCLGATAAAGASVESFSGESVDLPLYTPGSPRGERVTAMLDSLRRADGVVIASPAYHGTISGKVKNALDYIEDLSTAERAYLDGRPVGVIACGAGHSAPAHTVAALQGVVHALRGWPTPIGVAIDSGAIGTLPDGEPRFDDKVSAQLRLMGNQMVEFAAAFCHREEAMVAVKSGPEPTMHRDS